MPVSGTLGTCDSVEYFKKGKSLYWAPEYFIRPQVDINSVKIDMWCMGIALLIMLSGNPPFANRALNGNALPPAVWEHNYFRFLNEVRTGRLANKRVRAF